MCWLDNLLIFSAVSCEPATVGRFLPLKKIPQLHIIHYIKNMLSGGRFKTTESK